jgi:hypothetical protein
VRYLSGVLEPTQFYKLEDFLEGFPTVSRAVAVEALEEAKQLSLARAR